MLREAAAHPVMASHPQASPASGPQRGSGGRSAQHPPPDPVPRLPWRSPCSLLSRLCPQLLAWGRCAPLLHLDCCLFSEHWFAIGQSSSNGPVRGCAELAPFRGSGLWNANLFCLSGANTASPVPERRKGQIQTRGCRGCSLTTAGLAVSHRSFCWLRGVAGSRGQAHRVLPPPGGGQERVSASPPPDGSLDKIHHKERVGLDTPQGNPSSHHDNLYKNRFYRPRFTSEEIELRGHQAVFLKLI